MPKRKKSQFPRSQKQAPSAPVPARPALIVGIGASTGGLDACTRFIKGLPERANLGFVFIQHRLPQHDGMLAELLARSTRMPVLEAEEGVYVEPGHFYVCRPDRETTLRDGVFRLA